MSFTRSIIDNDIRLLRQHLNSGCSAELPLSMDQHLSGFTPLHLAAEHNALEVARELLCRGADINAYGNMCLDTKSTPIFIAIQGRHIRLIRQLKNAGADLSVLNAQGKTPIEHARSMGLVDIAAALENDAENSWSDALRKEESQYLLGHRSSANMFKPSPDSFSSKDYVGKNGLSYPF